MWMPWTRTAWTARRIRLAGCQRAYAKTDAVSFLIETLKTTPDVTILALGPMTNLAKVISCAPECLENLEALVSMGGSYKSHGNCSPVAEYNYWCDPDAAAEVFRAFSELPQLAGKSSI